MESDAITGINLSEATTTTLPIRPKHPFQLRTIHTNALAHRLLNRSGAYQPHVPRGYHSVHLTTCAQHNQVPTPTLSSLQKHQVGTHRLGRQWHRPHSCAHTPPSLCPAAASMAWHRASLGSCEWAARPLARIIADSSFTDSPQNHQTSLTLTEKMWGHGGRAQEEASQLCCQGVKQTQDFLPETLARRGVVGRWCGAASEMSGGLPKRGFGGDSMEGGKTVEVVVWGCSR